MRVIWFIDRLGYGGAEKMTYTILERIDRNVFDLRVCALQVKQGNPVARDLESIGIPVDILSIPNLRHIGNLIKITKYLHKHKPDIVHTQLEFATILGSFGAWLFRIPNISTIHTLNNPQTGTSHWRNELNWACMRYFSTELIAVSNSTRDHLVKNGRIPQQKILTMYNGIDQKDYQPTSKPDQIRKRRELGVPEESFLIVTVAVLREPKGIQFMIHAMESIVQSQPHIHYLIVGEGKYKENLENLVREKNLGKHISFAGQRSDISEILYASDLFVLPTLTDALPTVLIEAMSAGKAIVASNVGGVPEIVEDRISGILIQPGDPDQLAKSCLSIAGDDNKRKAMEIAGLRIVKEKFNIDMQVKALSKLYKEMVKHD